MRCLQLQLEKITLSFWVGSRLPKFVRELVLGYQKQPVEVLATTIF
ncbi:hypothetical protein ABIA85_010050 [Bradyrhizobium sp. LA6.10]